VFINFGHWSWKLPYIDIDIGGLEEFDEEAKVPP
jgi:hypothetical protein